MRLKPGGQRLSTTPQVKHAQLQAAGRRHAAAAAELAQAERQLARFGGLPADAAAAAAATQGKRAELARLRRRLQEHLDGMQ